MISCCVKHAFASRWWIVIIHSCSLPFQRSAQVILSHYHQESCSRLYILLVLGSPSVNQGFQFSAQSLWIDKQRRLKVNFAMLCLAELFSNCRERRSPCAINGNLPQIQLCLLAVFSVEVSALEGWEPSSQSKYISFRLWRVGNHLHKASISL